MERQPGPQPLALKRGLALAFFMVWPWFLVPFGLFWLKDFRLTMGLYELFGAGLPFLLFSRNARIPVRPLNTPWPVIIGLIVLTNLVFLSFFKVAAPLMVDWPVAHAHFQSIRMADNAIFWAFALFLIGCNPILEEAFWRGTVYRELKTVLTVRQATLITSFFFGAWHWTMLQYFCPPVWAIVLSVLVMVGGIIFTDFYERTGTLGSSILLHGLGADLPAVFIVYAALVNSPLMMGG